MVSSLARMLREVWGPRAGRRGREGVVMVRAWLGSGVLSRRLLLVASLWLALFSVFYSLAESWRFDDDQVNFLMVGVNIVHGGAVVPYLEGAAEDFSHVAQDRPGFQSLKARLDNLYNYVLPSTLFGLSQMGVTALSGGGSETLAKDMALSSLLGLALSSLLAVGVLGFCLWRHGRLVGPVFAAFVFFFLTNRFLPNGGYVELADDWLARLPLAVINPGHVFGIGGFTPRNNFLLVALGIFLARLGGGRGLSYALIPLALLFHRQQGMLLLALLLASDGLTRFRLLLDWRVLAPVTLGLVYVLAMETFWDRIGLDRTTALGIVVAGLGGLALLSLRFRGAVGVDRDEPPWRRALLDSGVFAGLWGLALALSLYQLSRGQDSGSAVYFWELLPARLMVVIQPLLVLSLMVGLGALLARWRGGVAMRPWIGSALSLASMVMAFVLCVGSVLTLPAQARRQVERVDMIQVEARYGVSPVLSYRDEEKIYLAVLEEVILGREPGTGAYGDLVALGRPSSIPALIIQGDGDGVLQKLTEGGCALAARAYDFTDMEGNPRRGRMSDVAAVWGMDELLKRMVPQLQACGIDFEKDGYCLTRVYKHGGARLVFEALGMSPEVVPDCESYRPAP